MIIKNCPAIKEITTLLTSEPPQFLKEWRCCTTGSNLKKCENITDCVMKKIVEECNNAKMRASDYYRTPFNGGVYDEAKRILDFLDIEECE